MLKSNVPKLDQREEHFWIPGPRAGMQLFLRRLSPEKERAPQGNRNDRIVLYVHGGTFPSPLSTPAWQIVTLEAQWARFTEDVPKDEPPVLSRAHFDEWGERCLDSDPDSRRREPAGVKIPTGPFNDIIHAWHGDLGYDPALVQAPVAIIRGEWDGVIPDEDARWLFDAFKASPLKRDIKIGRATHLMHLEAMRYALYRESI